MRGFVLQLFQWAWKILWKRIAVLEKICSCLYPKFLLMLCFVLQHVYIPIIFSSGVDYIDAPTPYMMGLHSGVDTSAVTMDGVSCNIKMRFCFFHLGVIHQFSFIWYKTLISFFLKGSSGALIFATDVWMKHLCSIWFTT